jgi:hypothetical protein
MVDLKTATRRMDVVVFMAFNLCTDELAGPIR